MVHVSNARRALGRRVATSLCAALLVAVAVVAGPASRPASGHAPHDEVVDIEFPADHEATGRVLAIVRGRLMRSEDGGHRWHEIVRGLGGEAQKLRDVAVSPDDGDEAWAVTSRGEVLRSDDAGTSWAPTAVPAFEPRRILAVPGEGAALVTDLEGETISRTTDGGASWDDVDVGHRITSWLVTGDGTVVLGDGRGRIHVSADGGATWVVDAELGDLGAPLAVTEHGADLLMITHLRHVVRLVDGGGATRRERSS